MSDAQKMWDDVIASTKAFFEHPAVKAYYEAEGKRRVAEFKKEQTEAKAKRDEIEAEKQRARSYDSWALNGGADECTQFGIRDGCKPECPVFTRGKCVIQDENEELFRSA